MVMEVWVIVNRVLLKSLKARKKPDLIAIILFLEVESAA
jgi:hypothetical protein